MEAAMEAPPSSTDTTPMSAADRARAQAKARRDRILGKANKRLGLVSGETHVDEEVKAVSASNAARIRAARQRRYGKKSSSVENAETDETKPETAASDANDASMSGAVAAVITPEGDVKPEIFSPDTTSTVEEVSPVGDVKETEDYTKDAKYLVEDVDEESGDSSCPASGGPSTNDPREQSTSTIDTEDTATKKKYVGVARARRRMILKKKLESESSSSGTASASRSASTVQAVAHKSVISQVPTMPIYMHIVTIVLLFLAGMDVGMQQFQEDVSVHHATAVNQYGVPVFHRSLSLTPEESATNPLMKELLRQSSADSESYSKDEDEFSEQIEEEKEPNIDPVFRVDLDEITKEPTIFNQFARMAISVHRFFLLIFYFGPGSILARMFGLPRLLFRLPPFLCLIALVLRQIVGKIVLGADIPSIENGAKKSKKDSSALDIDVLAMIKNWVSGFLSTAFPTAVGLYDAFAHLRADIYVVLCGVFCGILWSHYDPLLSTSAIETESSAKEDL